MREFLRKLKSIRLAIGLIAFLIAGNILATLIPQGLETERYFSAYPKLVATLIVETGFNRYFSSLLFLLPVIAFFFNLLACTIDRLLKESKKKEKRRHGPDMLHIGLLVLVVGSLISFSERKEGSVTMRVGDSVDLPNGQRLTLKEFIDERYANGRPREWTSVVDLAKGDAVVRSGVRIRVNDPLRVGGMTLYQATYGAEHEVELTDATGKTRRVARGEKDGGEGIELFFMTVDENQKAVVKVTGLPNVSVVRVDGMGTDIGPFKATLKAAPTTGLHAVTDPGYPVVVAGLLLISAGTALTFAQKLKETSI
ncbi:MAG: cytochrome c biogenesis protein ResB [Treponemataceae bacterium]